MPGYESLPILFALDESGGLRHVDDVPNGHACGCTCPDPGCGQELVAKNRGKVRIHHFAHRRGSCEWSVEHVLASLALEAVTSAGRIAFPGLKYFDAAEGRDKEISPARTLRVASASLESISGRGAPELVVTCAAGGAEKRFSLVVSLVHSLKDSELEKLATAGIDTVLIDLRASLRERKREAGKHFDRTAIVAGYQDRGYIERLLLDEGCPYKLWAVNSKRASAEAESVERERALQAERAKAQHERERRRFEREQKRIEQERRRLERERAESERQRVLREKADAERKAAGQAELEEASRRERERREQEKTIEDSRRTQRTLAAAAPEIAACDRNGNSARLLVRKGVKYFASECPRHGKADTVTQCGAYSYSPVRCPNFVRLRNYVVECAFKD